LYGEMECEGRTCSYLGVQLYDQTRDWETQAARLICCAAGVVAKEMVAGRPKLQQEKDRMSRYPPGM
jgi:hypothetical protein